MTEEAGRVTAAERGPNAWVQVISAFVVVAALAGGLWKYQKDNGTQGSGAAVPAGPISCSSATPTGVPTMVRAGVRYVSANRLCQALNRPDLAALLGTPGERALSYGGDDDSVTLGGSDVPAPEMNVTLPTYSVQLSASFDHFAVKDMADLLGGDAHERTFLGRPAVLYSDRTYAFFFGIRPAEGSASSAPSHPTRRLVVARDPKDGGGSYDIALWRQDSERPDDAVLLRLAARILPTLPGWGGSGS
ncbi:DUF6215 domain-containing protein [Streptomyces griseoruber]|uniref:Uncharacterized protein n=1 Tax=Streptomyces griseoruber TaxID=1943 RepID=A0A124I1J9_9ACTN|nr:DUF6215 domain-containing protein [Streptomyces griseoruber]KUN77535.1 hypothetical protein AQJ64_34005 [Streptomyces griseoruber]